VCNFNLHYFVFIVLLLSHQNNGFDLTHSSNFLTIWFLLLFNFSRKQLTRYILYPCHTAAHPYAQPIIYILRVPSKKQNSRSVTESELRSVDLGVRERYRLHIVDPQLIYRLFHKARGSQSLLSSHRCHTSWFRVQSWNLKVLWIRCEISLRRHLTAFNR